MIRFRGYRMMRAYRMEGRLNWLEGYPLVHGTQRYCLVSGISNPAYFGEHVLYTTVQECISGY